MKKLLIADDEPGIRALVRMTLEDRSYQIIEASDGAEALALAREHQPELVLLDVAMPGLSGFDVCRQLKHDGATSRIPVVMLTARAQQTDVEQGKAAGCDGYFTKPFSPTALLGKVQEIFSGRVA